MTVVLWDSAELPEPDAAVTVTVYVPDGVPGVVVLEWPPPPHPAKTPSIVTTTAIKSRCKRRLLIPPSETRAPRIAARATGLGVAEAPGISIRSAAAVVVGVVLIVIVDVATLPLGVTLVGEKLHDERAGRPEHKRLTA
jgi:hypothetical protein